MKKDKLYNPFEWLSLLLSITFFLILLMTLKTTEIFTHGFGYLML